MQQLSPDFVLDPSYKVWHMGTHIVSEHLPKLALYQLLPQALLARALSVPSLRSQQQVGGCWHTPHCRARPPALTHTHLTRHVVLLRLGEC